MIYSVYWLGLSNHNRWSNWGRSLLPNYKGLSDYQNQIRLVETDVPTQLFHGKKLLAEVIKETEDNTFVLILTPDIEPSFREWIAAYKLERNILYEMPEFIKNGNYPSTPPRLKLVYMGSNSHSMYDMFINDTETENSHEN